MNHDQFQSQFNIQHFGNQQTKHKHSPAIVQQPTQLQTRHINYPLQSKKSILVEATTLFLDQREQQALGQHTDHTSSMSGSSCHFTQCFQILLSIGGTSLLGVLPLLGQSLVVTCHRRLHLSSELQPMPNITRLQMLMSGRRSSCSCRPTCLQMRTSLNRL